MINLLVILLVTLFVGNTVGNDVLVNIQNGPIIGFQRTFNGRTQDTFLGIPYAQPPTGDLRFRKPLPVNGWSEQLKAKQWPNECPQVKHPLFYDSFQNKNFTEDCLYLNVFSRSVDSQPLKPVLVLIPSMGLVVGGSSMSTYDPIVLVDRTDVVVVTINFRLHVFGFLYAGSDEAPGNQGMYDQALALEWVKDNIKYFGGDPESITLFGQYSGAWSVGLHFLSPLTRNLFKNGMMMSGSPLEDAVDGTGYPIISKEASKSFTKEFIKKAGCGTDVTDDAISCLKRMDFDVLMEKSQEYGIKTAWVITGDQFLRKNPSQLLEEGDYKKNSQLIVGFMEDEGGVTLNYLVPEWFDTKTATKITKQVAIESIKKIEKTNIINKVNVNDVAKYYFSVVADDDYQGIEKQLGILIGDGYISCPSFNFARKLYEGDKKGTRVYGYSWSHKFPESVAPDDWIIKHCEPQMGACEFMDLYPVFGHPFKPGYRFSDRDKRMSDQLMTMLASFSRNGQPSPINGIEWPSFFTIHNQTMSPLYEFAATDETSGFKYNINGLECDLIWKS